MTSMKPIDDMPMPPAPEGVDVNTLTQDSVNKLDGALRVWIEKVARERRIGGRRAAVAVLHAMLAQGRG